MSEEQIILELETVHIQLQHQVLTWLHQYVRVIMATLKTTMFVETISTITCHITDLLDEIKRRIFIQTLRCYKQS